MGLYSLDLNGQIKHPLSGELFLTTSGKLTEKCSSGHLKIASDAAASRGRDLKSKIVCDLREGGLAYSLSPLLITATLVDHGRP